jgi:oligopeptide transport system substrate-binding protein
VKVSFLILVVFSLSQWVFASAVDFEKQSITIALTQEPPSLDSTRTTDLVSFFVLGHVNEGLIRYDKRGRLSPGVALSWTQKDDSILFTLRDNARWSDGSKLTADDFVYAWQLMNDPITAAPYASIMYPIKNAERIQKGELPPSSLGVTALDAHTLKVELESPCGYCIAMMVHVAFYPVKASFYEMQGDRYGADVENLLFNGPFYLSEWTHGAQLKMLKNHTYWNEQAITLNEINVGYITSDNRTRLNLFRDNSIALARLGAETVKDAAAQGLRLKTFLSGGMAYLRFNVTSGHPTHHKKLRQAIRLAFDPDEFVNKIIAIPGYKPAYSFFPSWLEGTNDKFVREYPAKQVEVDLQKARQLIKELKEELGVEVLPPITLLTVTSPTGTKIAEFFQGKFKQELGLDIKVDQQSFKQYIDKTNREEFDISLSSWYPDFDDLMTFADLLASYNANNRGRYENPEYDHWLSVLQNSSKRKTRMDAGAKLQNIIIEDVPVLPMAETGSAYIQHSQLKGVVRRVLGADPDYTFARVIKKKDK